MTYREWKDARQKSVNDLPLIFAFSNKQFEEALEKRGLTWETAGKIYSIGAGGYYLEKDKAVIEAFFDKRDDLPELMKDYDFAVDAFYYEMCNHEYGINWQRNWDVLSCFAEKELKYYEDDYGEGEAITKYFDDMGLENSTRMAYAEARRRYFKTARENNWL